MSSKFCNNMTLSNITIANVFVLFISTPGWYTAHFMHTTFTGERLVLMLVNFHIYNIYVTPRTYSYLSLILLKPLSKNRTLWYSTLKKVHILFLVIVFFSTDVSEQNIDNWQRCRLLIDIICLQNNIQGDQIIYKMHTLAIVLNNTV